MKNLFDVEIEASPLADNENQSFGSDLQLGTHDVDVQNGLGYYDDEGNFHRFPRRDCFGEEIC